MKMIYTLILFLVFALPLQIRVTSELEAGCADGAIPVWNAAQNKWRCGQASGEGVPSGAVIVITSGSCPNGYSEVSALNGVTVVGTTSANGDVGTTGGSNTVTPVGTVASSFNGTPFSQVIDHSHGVNISDPGHAHVQGVNSATTGGLSGYTPDTSSSTRVNSGYSTSSSTTGITAATSSPVGSVPSITPSGSVLSTFTGASMSVVPSHIKCIFCRKD